MRATLFVFLVAVPLALVAATVLIAVALSRREAPAPSRAAEAARSHGIAVNVIAWLVALGVGPLLLGGVGLLSYRVSTDATAYPGIAIALYPTLVGLLFVGVHAVGERTWPRPTGR